MYRWAVLSAARSPAFNGDSTAGARVYGRDHRGWGMGDVTTGARVYGCDHQGRGVGDMITGARGVGDVITGAGAYGCDRRAGVYGRGGWSAELCDTDP